MSITDDKGEVRIMTYYTACFLKPDGSGKPRIVRFGTEQYTFDRNAAFSTCQQMADETGERILITETETEPHYHGEFHVIRPTKRMEV